MFRSSALRVLVAAGLLATLLPMGGCRGGWRALKSKFHHRRAKSKENTTDYADNVETAVTSGQLMILERPDYSDVQQPVQQFYDDRNYELAWTRDLKPTDAATQLIALFQDAARKGLNPEDYDASRWPARLQQLAQVRKSNDTSDAAQDTVAQFDAAMTIAAMRYLADLHSGRINPQALNFDIDTPKKRADFDLPTFLNDQLVDADDAASLAASVEPKSPMYVATEQALPRYLDLARQEQQAPMEPLPAVGKPIGPGAAYPGLSGLVARLQREGDLTSSSASNVYSADIAEGVKHYQQRHGITPDGKLNDATVASLNVPMAVRVQQLDNSLERWRWLPDTYQQPRLLVNLPEFLVRAYTPDHSLAFTMKVVDGEAQGNHDTPTFVRLMRYVVFRPYWNLPTSIVKKEIVGHLEKSGMGYLDAHGYEVVNGSGTAVNASVEDLEHGRYQVRQKPGPKNSLGLVKFLFPNEYDVYMHSTPELNLFNLTRRDRSHGCVRLQHADQMAQWVLSIDNPDGDWDQDKVSGMMSDDANNNKTVNLKTPLAVSIMYLTANVDEDGNVDFFNDIYGYDQQLEAALAKPRPYPQQEAKINPKLIPGETE
jgi:murein L,D-transpeptidase YcbB/YkuD